MILALARLPLARWTRRRRGWLAALGWSAFATLAAVVARNTGYAAGVDHVMRGSVGVVVLPLLTYGIVSASLGGAGLRASVRGLVALGAPPARAALASVLFAMAASAVACALVSALVCLIAHGHGDPPLLSDLPATVCVAFLAGGAYAAYFGAGSAIGRGAMRGLFLALDWVLGASGGLGAILTPRGHVMSLLGGPLCFDLSRRTSSVLLVVMLGGYLAMAVRLGRMRPR
jgi:hypothetical protein